MDKQVIYLWGFAQEDVADWPKVFAPVRVTELPQDQPVLVHYQGLAAYQAQVLARPRPDGRLPDALLYLPKGVQPPPGFRSFFDATVQEGEWSELRKLFACPQQFRMQEMADELPAPFLAGLSGPVHHLAPAKLPLPPDVVAHLTTCMSCLQAFYQALTERLQWRRQLHWPSPAQLEAYFQGVTDLRIAAHLAICQACRRELSLLEQAISPPWFRLPLHAREAGPGNLAGERFEVIERSVKEGWAQWVAALLGALQGAQMQPSYATGVLAGEGAAGARVRRISAATPEPAQLLARLRADREMRFTGPERSLLLGWDEEQRILTVRDLREEGQPPLPAFEVSLWEEGKEVWAAHSQAGGVEIPAATMTSGMDEMQIRDSAGSS